MDLAAQTLGKELGSGESRLWFQSFRFVEPAALEWAFREFFLGNLADRYGNYSGVFFPKPAEIAELVHRYKQRQLGSRQDKEQQTLLEDMHAARKQQEAEGQPVGLAQMREILKQCCERVKQMP